MQSKFRTAHNNKIKTKTEKKALLCLQVQIDYTVDLNINILHLFLNSFINFYLGSLSFVAEHIFKT